MRISKEEYLKCKEVVDRYLLEQSYPHDCVICGIHTRDDGSYYAGDNPICSQTCLSQWDEENPNPWSENFSE